MWLAGTILLLAALFGGTWTPRPGSEYRRLATAGLLLFLGGNGLGILGLRTMTAGPAALLVTMAPIFMALIELGLPDSKKLALIGWCGLAMGFLGVIWLIFSGEGLGVLDPMGAALTLLGSMAWAAGSVFTSRMKLSLPPSVQIGFQMFSGGICLLISGWCVGETANFHPTSSALAAFFYMLCFDALIANSLYLRLLKVWPAAKVGTYAYITPFIAGLAGVIWLREPMNIGLALSGLVILGGVGLVQRARFD